MAEWQNPETLVTWLLIIILIVSSLVFTLILFVRTYIKRIVAEEKKLARAELEHQQELLKVSVKVQERERNRIASGLHDDIIGKMNVVLISLYSDQQIKDPKVLLKDCIDLTRKISHDLSPPLLEQTRFSELANEFLIPLQNNYEISFIKNVNGCKPLKTESKLQLFRIFQELINNIIKHAEATKIKVQLRFTEKNYTMLVEDNGIGIPEEIRKNGLGLKNIELRSQYLNGVFKYKNKKGGGTIFLLNFKQFEGKNGED